VVGDFSVIPNCSYCGASLNLQTRIVEHKPDCVIVAQINGDPVPEIYELTPEMELDATSFESELARLVNRHSMERGAGNTPDFILAGFLNAVLHAYSGALSLRDHWSQSIESNFSFYIDGYTLNGTDTVGEILVTAPDGKTKIVSSSAFTAFLARRIDS